MLSLLRALHTLTVALWFGSVAFFSIAGLLIFQAFEEVSRQPAEQRPWLPIAEPFTRPSPGKGFADPTQLEQGSRLAGVAVSNIFPTYYALQASCGAVALLTALLLARSSEGSAHRWRIALATLGLLTVLAGWALERKVHELRLPRNTLTDQVLATSTPDPDLIERARAARAAFGMWHGISLLQNFATLGLAAGLTLLIPATSGRR